VTHLGDEERRRRVGVRHRLAPGARASSLREAAAAMVALHATDPAGLFLEARARMTGSSPASLSAEMYDDRTVFRLWAMRRTLFLAAVDDVPVIHAAASRAVAETERRRTLGMLAGAGTGPEAAARRLGEREAVGLEAIRARGEVTTADLRALDPRLDRRITTSRGTSYEGTISVASKVAFQLALDGHLGRDRPRGTWLSGQFRWSPTERWLPGGIRELPVDAARAELVRRWLLVFGPGTQDDVAWWTGWGVGATRQALAAAGAVEVRLDGGQAGYVLPGDLEATPEPEPWVALLPVLDATTMGWKDRQWYLGPHRAALFDGAGNAGPTIWADGRIVGGWAQRPSGEIALRLLEPVDAGTAGMIDAEAERLAAWLGPTRIRWPFPPP
jgi:Winged helix DNA-binding domain